jgi:hypothetical protein
MKGVFEGKIFQEDSKEMLGPLALTFLPFSPIKKLPDYLFLKIQISVLKILLTISRLKYDIIVNIHLSLTALCIGILHKPFCLFKEQGVCTFIELWLLHAQVASW